MKNKILIFASEYNGEFYPEHIIEDLNTEFNRLEYGDVVEKNFQIWEYPSGKIFKIEVDRKIKDEKYYYSSPNKNIWLPVLKEIGEDSQKVFSANQKLSES